MRRPGITNAVGRGYAKLLKLSLPVSTLMDRDVQKALKHLAAEVEWLEASKEKRAAESAKVQAIKSRNSPNKVSTRAIEYKGRVQGLTAWARELGFIYGTVHQRMRSGETFEEALNENLDRRYHLRAVHKAYEESKK